MYQLTKYALSGVQLPEGNACDETPCPNDGCTVVWLPFNSGRQQYNVCAWHLKKLVENGTYDKELA